MVKSSIIRTSNALIPSTLPQSPTAIFAGATAGIGFESLKKFVTVFSSPTISFTGRSKATGDKIIQELQPLNKEAKYVFLAGDLTLIAEVKRIGEEILHKVKKAGTGVDYVFLSPGYLDFSGRQGMFYSFTYPRPLI